MTLGVRSLEALSKHGSTSRVLNLHRIHERCAQLPEHRAQPFFHDRFLNRAFIIKHRLRSDETYLMRRTMQVATKIVFPFDRESLGVGGQSLFVGQSGYKDAITAIIGPDSPETRHDFEVLRLLSRLPSLDPFLVRVHLRRNGILPADCYFEIAPADIDRMRSFVADQVCELISLAFRDRNAGSMVDDLVTRLVDALMSADADERLEPLRLTLGLDGDAFREGVFSWSGFLYYKWQMADAVPLLNRVVREVDVVHAEGRMSASDRAQIETQRSALKVAIRAAIKTCQSILQLYDRAFGDLVKLGHAAAFRKFLLEAPRLFMDLGHGMGTIAHIGSFWAYRFPDQGALAIDGSDFLELLIEFEQSLAIDPRQARIR